MLAGIRVRDKERPLFAISNYLGCWCLCMVIEHNVSWDLMKQLVLLVCIYSQSAIGKKIRMWRRQASFISP